QRRIIALLTYSPRHENHPGGTRRPPTCRSARATRPRHRAPRPRRRGAGGHRPHRLARLLGLHRRAGAAVMALSIRQLEDFVALFGHVAWPLVGLIAAALVL